MSDGRTFFYHAQGTPIGGVFRQPFVDVLESHGATALPITGGYGSAQKKDINFHDKVKVKEASTVVEGKQDSDGSYKTSVKTTIVDLNVDNVVTANRIVCSLSSVRSANDTETRVSPADISFEGLSIGGQAINPVLDLSLFKELDTSAKFKDKYKHDKDFRDDMRSRFLWGKLEDNAPDFLKARYKWQSDPEAQPESQGIVPCSLVKTLGNVGANLKAYGNVIVVPNFGTIYFAEFHVKESARRLTMMRMMLGSPMVGDLTVVSCENNGVHFP